MKRIVVIAFVIMAIAATASAQESSKCLGIKGGLNMFKVYGDDVADDVVSYLYGFAVGGFFTYNINETFALQPELYYSMKGWKLEAGTEETDVKFGYIDIPVLIKVNIPLEGKSFAPNMFAGPYMAFNMSADIEGEDFKDEIKSTDFGLVVGAGVDVMLKEGVQMLTFDFRYSIGFAKLDDEGEAESFNNGFQFLLGYGFSL